MPAFEYQALDNDGRRRKGVIEADSPRGARALLRERGLSPLAVDAAASDARPGQVLFRRRLGGGALALLTRELATLLAAGLPIEEALGALAEQAEDPHQRGVLANLRARVREGSSLAAALAEQPGQFPEYFRASVAAAEQSGRIDSVLARLADYAESHAALRRRVWMALLYPLLLTGVALMVVAGLLLYVVPQVIEVFSSLNRELPWLTRALIALSEALPRFGPWLLALAVLAGVGIRALLRDPARRASWQSLLLRLPLIGRLRLALDTSRFTRTLGLLTGSGVPMLDALRMATGTAGLLPLRQALERAGARVREGAGLAVSLAESRLFPPVTLRLIGNGERAGRLPAMLDQAADHEATLLENRLSTFVAVLGPAMILLVGVLVLAIVLAILLPIFELNTLLG
ncbi:type II secretion system inner membrane protein GspF [Pseudofulvimonas gallinarii]|uniref:General secretion pathway protein F n=3 Tax=Pseudofulvimonas gallinarii TaxID=634155 RepID=A0A4S3KX33_9GAMM|nr:type II secretion system inner membrane protein GspF [Pseudofulvimonas gallinarii]TCS98194.1 type II secretion system protein F (GspF) [Pseudofulvimonas gallinarii]THD13872.1 type II secretion system protein GspF [Pseudofulvimonas gallinarii]